ERVHRLIAGPGGVYTCNECVNLCREIIEEEQARTEEEQARTPSPKPLVAKSASPGGTGSNPAYDLLACDNPEVAKAFSGLYEAILGAGALDAKTKHLISIAVLGALRSVPALRAQI